MRLILSSYQYLLAQYKTKLQKIMEEAYKQRKEKLKEAEDLLAGINDYVLNRLGMETQEVDLEKKIFIVNCSSLEGRYDPRFYQPRYMFLIEELNKQPHVKTIGEISKYVGSGSTPKAKGDAYTTKERGIPFIRVTNIKDDRIDLTDAVYITREIHERTLRRTRLKPNDVLLSMAGTIGVSTVVPDNFCEANINQALARIVLKGEISPLFVAIILNTKIGRLQTKRLSRPAVQANINLPEIKSIKIPVPPIEIQNEIATEVQRRRRLAKRLREEATKILEGAKKCVGWMILGGEAKAREMIHPIADKLKEEYNPQKIILFGSYAWGLPDEDSDIDLLIIRDTEEKPHNRMVHAARIISPLRRGYAVDILVLTPEELKSRLEIGDQFLQEIISRGEVLYG
jgi:predicted nucleotidyltransferase/alkylated DNA nucleotide flippase Atl1